MTVNGQDMQLLHEQTASEIREDTEMDKPDTLIKRVQQIERVIMGKDT